VVFVDFEESKQLVEKKIVHWDSADFVGIVLDSDLAVVLHSGKTILVVVVLVKLTRMELGPDRTVE
jgi:hypothetical protein